MEQPDLTGVALIVAFIIGVLLWIAVSIMLWREHRAHKASHEVTNRLIDAIRDDRVPDARYQPQYTPRHWTGKTK